MTSRITIIGSGFAGMWAALSAARARAQAGRGPHDLQITVISPHPALVIRPRLYEAALDEMTPDLQTLFERVQVRHVAAGVERIDRAARTLHLVTTQGHGRATETYDRLVLAAGSVLNLPPIPGLQDHAFNVDQIEGARALDRHLRALAREPGLYARDTVVVAGGGFTGIETATELPQRLRDLFGASAKPRVVLVERADAIGPDLGPGPRPQIEQALRELGVGVRTGVAAAAVDPGGLMLEGGERIDARTVIWTAGVRAHPLAEQIAGERDRFGRLHVTAELRVKGLADVYATGDVAFAATDDAGHHALMSCQHAIALGRAAGHNAAADLLGLPAHPYRQEKYVTCLDLGAWGAVFTEGWDRQVKFQGMEGKQIKRTINTQWIYPPQGDRDAVLAAADPSIPVVA
ncbi:MAG: FAD-dependent pyridine nucleotide-disulfide oxidoreductase [Panacagrimonas sp.]|jgi:NADH dehydrogenase|nr:NAD(P)/FAD-dependent oxidoreductase [Panacagrimonas sp.]MCC2658273.1 FAD-dependent pyridine nucleotide-disulfide oxidoreductase [Panacagrimonas sp.]